jgi:hypothetical protein
MRNRLIHAYFDVENDFVWKTATEELPALFAKAAGPTWRPLRTGAVSSQAMTFASRNSSSVVRW